MMLAFKESHSLAVHYCRLVWDVRSLSKSTIVFDDPVNSLDHKIISAFTNEVMDLDNQLLIFTHSKLFPLCVSIVVSDR